MYVLVLLFLGWNDSLVNDSANTVVIVSGWDVSESMEFRENWDHVCQFYDSRYVCYSLCSFRYKQTRSVTVFSRGRAFYDARDVGEVLEWLGDGDRVYKKN